MVAEALGEAEEPQRQADGDEGEEPLHLADALQHAPKALNLSLVAVDQRRRRHIIPRRLALAKGHLWGRGRKGEEGRQLWRRFESHLEVDLAVLKAKLAMPQQDVLVRRCRALKRLNGG